MASTFVPVTGQVGKGAKLVQGANKVADAVRVGDKVADGVRVADRVQDGTRVAGGAEDGVRVGSKADDVGRVELSLLSRAKRILGDLPLNSDTLADLYKAGRLSMDEARALAKNVDWKDEAGKWIYPPNDGFNGAPQPKTLRAGDNITIDRYGKPTGSFASPTGEAQAARALPGNTDFSAGNYHVYKVTDDIDILAGKATPWFDQPGGAIQYKLGSKIQDLLDQGSLIELTQ